MSTVRRGINGGPDLYARGEIGGINTGLTPEGRGQLPQDKREASRLGVQGRGLRGFG